MEWQLYDYYLPKENLALKPAVPRDHSRIFVYHTQTDQIQFDLFYNLDHYLPKESFLVLNNTRVLPARVVLRKETGGKIEILFLINEGLLKKRKNQFFIRFIPDREIKVGERIYFNSQDNLLVVDQNKHIFLAQVNFSKEKFFSFLKKQGSMPIPLYLRRTPLKKESLFKKYQTVFSQKQDSFDLGSVAAPTASLHFTNRVFKKLEKKGVKKCFVTLYIGLGTFAPVNEENIKNKRLHQEYYQVNDKVWEKIKLLKSQGKKLVAVGTTVVRTLESLARQYVFSSPSPPLKAENPPSHRLQKQLSSLIKTNLFIFPPFDFQMVDCLITNFHLPKSSLMMLVEAFLQYKKAKRHLVDLYKIAIKNNFRFYSFGDAMVVI